MEQNGAEINLKTCVNCSHSLNLKMFSSIKTIKGACFVCSERVDLCQQLLWLREYPPANRGPVIWTKLKFQSHIKKSNFPRTEFRLYVHSGRSLFCGYIVCHLKSDHSLFWQAETFLKVFTLDESFQYNFRSLLKCFYMLIYTLAALVSGSPPPLP